MSAPTKDPIRIKQKSSKKSCAADFSPCWHGCRCPLVWTNSLFRQALDCKSSRLRVSTCCRFCRLCRFRWLCRFSPTNPQVHKSAPPIFPVGGMAATAPMSRPAVFFVKPWTVQSQDPGTLPDRIPASATPCPWRGSGGRIGATWG